MKDAFVCVKHFEEKYLNRKTTRPRLNPVPTLFSESQQKLPGSILTAIVKTRNPPGERYIQEDELATFSCQDSIKDFSDIKDSLL